MKIQLEKFGNTLTSRPAGKDAYAGFLSVINGVKDEELVEVDFTGVSSFSPSWGDEFLSPLLEKFKERLILINTQNPSVSATIETLEENSGNKFQVRSPFPFSPF